MTSEPWTICPAQPDHAPALVGLIHELAVYEHLEHLARATPDLLREHLFGANPCAEALIAEVAGEPVGFALFYPTYSTFRCQPGFYLEDVFVRAEHRGRGIGRSLLKAVARIAVERGGGRLEWAVLNWNEPASAFYQVLGARPLAEWMMFRLDDEGLARLGRL